MSEAILSTPALTILFVDDEPSILSALRRLFRPHGYRILTAESGAAGLEILSKEKVDMVVSDVRMPEMDGVAFLEKVNAGWPGTVRILLTGYADMSTTADAIGKSDIFCYISKPWDADELVLTVRSGFERQRLQRERQAAWQQKQDAFEGRQKWLLLASSPVSLLLTWLSVVFLGWPAIQNTGEPGVGALLLSALAIWGALVALLFGLTALRRRKKNPISA
ncbi:MAG: response regulator [Burkholderiaceae bacterium]|nr:response regulator [Burkholderiaceae bacterium]